MTTIDTFDLTGANSLYKRTNVRARVFENNQVVQFNEPVFASSISIFWLQDNGSTPGLTEGIHYILSFANRDHDGMSAAKQIDPAFTDVLVDGFTISENLTEEKTYVIEYQALKLLPSQLDFDNDGPFPTPGLMRELFNKVQFLTLTRDPINNITSTTLNNVNVFVEDVTGVNEDNHVFSENHAVDVPGGIFFIRPGSGSFYEHDFVIVNPLTSNTLVRGIDYELVGINIPKTKLSEHTSGVYEYAMLLPPFVGTLEVSYRAFGGDVSVKDINAIKDVLADIVRLVADGGFLTAETMPFTPSIIQILTRLAELEDHHLHFITAHHRFIAQTTGKHWFTIAELYTDTFTPEVLTTAQVQFALKSGTRQWSYETIISLNLDRLFDKVRTNVLSSIDKYNYFAIGEYPNLDKRNIPEIRVVWNDVAGDLSGAQIQIGMQMTAGQYELLSVYDKSGNGSLVAVRPNAIGADTVYDDNILLPDGTTWVSGSADAQEARAIMSPEEGYLVWGGSYPAHELLVETELNNVIRTNDFKVSNIKKTSFFYYDRVKDKYIVQSQENQWDNREIIHDTAIFFAEDLCGIEYKLWEDSLGVIRLTVKHSIGSNSLLNERFDLRQIVVHL